MSLFILNNIIKISAWYWEKQFSTHILSLKVSSLSKHTLFQQNLFIFTLSAIQNYIIQWQKVLHDIKIKVKQVEGAECNVVFMVVCSSNYSFSIFFNIKKMHHEKSAAGKSAALKH